MPFPFNAPRREDLRRGGRPATSEAIMLAQSKGAGAVSQGISIGDNPYRFQRTPESRFLSIMWFRGYRAEQERLREGAHSGE